ncbi:MAG: DUF839 domain-containing protein [Phenylobacterium sp.]|uniref:alkaline phosphatase PhoX n=1 Tax=Phenylobacterium sp. TaxID=1871053 RepID=UPI002716165B|nr:alkaline phosphatase PhoX [Phenylobacterium sp.]MDO8409139.1 DUF839 domain-containing protein [Phenylobacterium sp.]
MPLHRRALLGAAAAGAAFSGYAMRAKAQTAAAQAAGETYLNEVHGYGPLIPDPYKILDLPEGFSYRVISHAGQTMDDGFFVPYKADGMAAIPVGGSKIALLRNHELNARDLNYGPTGPGRKLIDKLKPEQAYDVGPDGYPLPGGVTTLIYDLKSQRLESQHLSLTGTLINCAGGATPWGSWLSCEETTLSAQAGLGKSHGWVFEVPATAKGLVDPVPLTAMGRFQHEAAAVDPGTGVIYETEDSFDSKGLFYRFLPHDRRNPAKGGRLQALGFRNAPEGGDARNMKGSEPTWRVGESRDCVWIDVEGSDNPHEDLRLRMQAAGAAFIGRGEGIFWSPEGVYFTCTSSGPAGHGQVLRYIPSPHEGQAGEADAPGRLELFVEPTDSRVMDFADNLAISPWGHMFACEDRYSETLRNHLKGITPDGRVYTIARNVFEGNAELAGACFSPDGSTCFVNIYWPGLTLAITGPWNSFRV